MPDWIGQRTCTAIPTRPEYAITTGGIPTSIAAGDFKGDGAGDDIAVVDTTGTVSVFLNKRDGSATFSAPSTVAISGGKAPYFIASGRFTQSGQSSQDLVVADSAGNITILTSSSGVFAITAQKALAGVALASMIAVDVNGDGLSDVVAGDSSTAQISVVAGAGNGKLQAPTGPFSSGLPGSQPIFVAAGNFTTVGQPLPDLAAVTQDGTAAVLQNVTSGAINFDPGTIVSSTGACGFGGNTQPPVTAAVAGYFGQPSGSFAGLANLAIASIPPASANCPPAVNILSNQGPPPPFFLSFYYGAEPAAVGLTPVALAVADVNGDLAPDIVMASQGDNSVSVLVNDSTGNSSFCGTCTFNPIGQEFGTGSGPVALVTGNFHMGKNQPFPDLATAHQPDSAGNAMTVLSNLGNGTDATGNVMWLGYGGSCIYDPKGQVCSNDIKQARTDYIAFQTQAPTAISITNFFSQAPSGLPDFAMTGQAISSLFLSSSVVLFENDCNVGSPCLTGDFTSVEGLNFFSSTNNYLSMTAADFNGDGYSDTAVMDNTGTASLFLSSLSPGSPVGFAPGSQYPVTAATSSFIASGTFISGHAQNQRDLVVAGSQENVTVLSNNSDGTGNFTVLPAIPITASFSSVVAADLNGDGNTDVVAADANTGKAWVFQGPVNPATGAFANSFQVTTNLPAQQQPVSVAIGFSQTHVPVYLVAVSQDGTISLLANTSSGSTINFGTPVVYATSVTGIPGGVTAVTTADFNLDGTADVAIASAASGHLPSVWFFPNTSSGGAPSLGAAESFLTASTPVALAAADMNQDGVPDLMIVNQGSNTASILISNGNSKATVTLGLTSSLNPSGLGQSVTFTASVSANSGNIAPTGTVQFLDGSDPIGTSPLTNGSAMLTTAALTTGTHAITALYSGDVYFNPRTSTVLMQVVAAPPDFGLSISPGGATVTAGNPANFTVKLTPQNSFSGMVALSCTWMNMPSGVSCQLSSATLTLSSGGPAATSTLTITTTSGSLASMRPLNQKRSAPLYAFWLWSAPIAFSVLILSRRRHLRALRFFFLAVMVGTLLISVSCGGGGSNPVVTPTTSTPPGTYSITVNATSSSGAIQHSSVVAVTVQ